MKRRCLETLVRAIFLVLCLCLVAVAQTNPTSVTLEPANPDPNGAIGIQTQVSPGKIQITGAGGAGGTITLALPPSLPLISCSGTPCLGPATIQVSHTLTGFALVSIQILGSSSPNCAGESAGLSAFVSPSVVSCVLTNVPLTSQGGTFVFASIKLQIRGAARSDLSVQFNWRPPAATTCPASTSPAAQSGLRQQDASACPAKDSIKMDVVLPFEDQPVQALAEGLSPFCASGTYTLGGTSKRDLHIELLDDRNRVVGRSKLLQVDPGTNVDWGVPGCDRARSKDWVIIPEATFKDLEKANLWQYSIDAVKVAESDTILGRLRLQAVLSSDTVDLATSDPITYTVIPGGKLISAKLRLTDGNANRFVPEDVVLGNSKILQADDSFRQRSFLSELRLATGVPTSFNDLFLDVELNFPGDGANHDGTAILDTQFSAANALGDPVPIHLFSSTEVVNIGKQTAKLRIQGIMAPPGVSQIVIEPLLTFRDVKVLLGQVTLNVNSLELLAVSPDHDKCTFQQQDQCLVYGKDNKIQVQLRAKAAEKFKPATADGNPFILLASTRDLQQVAGIVWKPLPSPTIFQHSIQTGIIAPPADAFQFVYSMRESGSTDLPALDTQADVERAFTNIISTIDAAASSEKAAFAKGEINKKTAASNAINVIRSQAASVNAIINTYYGVQSKSEPKAPAALAVGNRPDLLLLEGAWLFDPPVSRNTGYSAELTLRYTANQLPADPNFNEAKIQIISVDNAGGVHFYPTTLDTVKKEATARIDSIDPYYALGVVGPFVYTPVMITSSPTGYVLVNAGAQATNLNLTDQSPDGLGNTTRPILNSLNMIKSTSPGWVRSWSDSPSTVGASWQETGKLLAVHPARVPDTLFLIPSIENKARTTTEIHLANPNATEAVVTITLVKPDGTEQGKQVLILSAGYSDIARIQSLFPGLPQAFTGYALIESNRPIAASGLRRTSTATSALVAQSVIDAGASGVVRYAPVLADAKATGTLHLVNRGTAAAAVSIKARQANGSAAAPDVIITLPPRQQYTKDLTEIFGTAPIASIEVSSGAPGILGDLLTSDSSFNSNYAVSLPLSAEPSANVVLPYVTGSTSVSVFNPSSTAANVAITPYGSNGAAGTVAGATVAPGGRALIVVRSTGFAVLRSNQPVIAAALVTSTAGGIGGYPAIPVPATGTGGSAGPVPSATSAGVLHAASFRGGAVAPGEIVTVFGSDIGPATLTTLKLDAQGKVATDLNTARVLFDGVPAPMIYALAGQNSVIVPYSVASRGSTQMVVEYQGRQSAPVSLAVTAAAPGLFSINSSGTGPGAIINQNGSLNTASNPAAAGSVVVLYGTGEGQTTPSGIDGNVANAVFPKPVLPVSVSIGGRDAKVLYAGAAPNLVAGVLQVNVEVPAGLAGGNQPVLLSVGPASSQPGLTVAIASGQAQAPLIAVNPASLDFGNVSVGQTMDLPLTVRNNGTANLVVSALGSSNPRFSSAQSTPFTVSPGSLQNIVIRFSPTAAGGQTGIITLATNDPASLNRAISVSGSGTVATAPSIAVNPASIDFGTVNTGQTRDQTIVVRNAGTASLIVSTISGSNPRFAYGGITLPFTLTAGASQALTIRFSPIAAGQQSGTITITSNDPAHLTTIVNVTGNGSGTGGTLPVITFGQTINGTLSVSTPGRSVDCSTCYADTYQLTVTTARNIVITLNSTAFDSFLQLLDENSNLLFSDDDSGGGLNARISGTIQPGIYRIEVTTANNFETGAYTLAIAQ